MRAFSTVLAALAAALVLATPARAQEPTAPGAPGTATPIGRGTLTLTWASATVPGGGTPTYTVEHRDADDAAWTTVATGVGTTSLSFPSWSPEQQGTWRYRVRASAAGVAGPASAASLPVVVDRVAPPAPIAATDRSAEDASGGAFRDTVTVRFVDRGDPDLPDGTPGAGTNPGSLPAPRTFAASGRHTARGRATDRAGNRSPEASSAVTVDAGHPSAALACPPTVGQWSAAEATWTASDPEGGLVMPVRGGVPLDSATAGPGRATFVARDAVGHETTAECAYTVLADVPVTEDGVAVPHAPPASAAGTPAPARDDGALSTSPPAVPGGAAPPPARPAVAGVLRVAESRARVSRSGRVGLTVACPTGGLGGCRASLEVRTLAGGRRRSVRLGRAFTALIPGASRRLSVALSRGGRARLSPKGTRVVVLLRPDVHIAPVRQTLTLLPSPHTRR